MQFLLQHWASDLCSFMISCHQGFCSQHKHGFLPLLTHGGEMFIINEVTCLYKKSYASAENLSGLRRVIVSHRICMDVCDRWLNWKGKLEGDFKVLENWPESNVFFLLLLGNQYKFGLEWWYNQAFRKNILIVKWQLNESCCRCRTETININ